MEEAKRRKSVEAMLALTENTPAAANAYERDLLERYVRGNLSIEEVITLLEAAKC